MIRNCALFSEQKMIQMHQDYIKTNPWSIIEEGYHPDRIKSSESLFSIGNGAMGQRANFEEDYSGSTFQGNYIAGVYYPDKTKVGWWKNGYPEYFAKVLNAPNWIGIHIKVNEETLDLHQCTKVKDFVRELNMKEGWYKRSFIATLPSGNTVKVDSIRLLSLKYTEVGAIRYSVTPLNSNLKISITPYLDAGITNEDSNWDDQFWEILEVTSSDKNSAVITSQTCKTNFHVATGMRHKFFVNQQEVAVEINCQIQEKKVFQEATFNVVTNQTVTIEKYGGYAVSTNYPKAETKQAIEKALKEVSELGFQNLLEQQINDWKEIWEMSDIEIEGDLKAQQGIRFNIFQLNQTYSGKDARLNIGPKGFTGEKYGGSTYWDTEAYCLPFYMSTKNQQVAKNLLNYRYNHLEKAIENAKKLGFTNGAALYPMVTMNGEECHNEWEITFEEIHRNGAMTYAIYNYVNYTGDYSYIPEKGLEVMIGVARFWQQRANFSSKKQQYVILGVTGPNEYENNINNNYYTNYLAKWCIEYAIESLEKVKQDYPKDWGRIWNKTGLSEVELSKWEDVAKNMYFPYCDNYKIYLQQDGFLDKDLVTLNNLDQAERPINQKWSWDRILRSPYIKQADTLQGMYMFDNEYSREELKRHFDFYEPFTVHESSLSPCVHSIIAARIGNIEQAYEFYLRTSRLDLDDYNKEVEEGCHITSMAGTWMSIVEGFGGMKVLNNELCFTPQIPKNWDRYAFKINFRNHILQVNVTKEKTSLKLIKGDEITVKINGKEINLSKEIISA